MNLDTWEPTEDERKAICAALSQERPDLSSNEQALLLAEERDIAWVRQTEREQLASHTE